MHRPDDDNRRYGEPNDQEKIYDYLAKNKTTKRLDQSCLNLGEQVGESSLSLALQTHMWRQHLLGLQHFVLWSQSPD